MEHKSNRPRGLNRRGFLAVTTSTVTLLAAAKAKAQEIEAQKREDAAEPLANVQGASGRRAETELRINGQIYRIAADTRTSLLDALREHLGLTGTKKGCDHGQCGACTVHVDGVASLSCLTLAAADVRQRGDDDRRTATRRQPASDAAGLHRSRRISVRVLHARAKSCPRSPASTRAKQHPTMTFVNS